MKEYLIMGWDHASNKGSEQTISAHTPQDAVDRHRRAFPSVTVLGVFSLTNEGGNWA